MNGVDGTDGQNGIDGKDGTDGVNGKDGVDAKNIEVQRAETHIQWRYEGGEWQNLVAIADIEGPAGQNGTDGINGKTPEFRVSENILQWRYVGDEIWLNLYDLTALKGADGRDGVDGKDGINGKDGADGKDGTNGKDGVNGTNGANGKNGVDGKNGIDGKNGANGKDGTNGVDGENGADGQDGADGVDGKDTKNYHAAVPGGANAQHGHNIAELERFFLVFRGIAMLRGVADEVPAQYSQQDINHAVDNDYRLQAITVFGREAGKYPHGKYRQRHHTHSA
mgnify:CR=1 FL=1